LKENTIFAAVARWEVLWEAATSGSRWALAAMPDSAADNARNRLKDKQNEIIMK
jgi:hypothetical protein